MGKKKKKKKKSVLIITPTMLCDSWCEITAWQMNGNFPKVNDKIRERWLHLSGHPAQNPEQEVLIKAVQCNQ